MLKVEFVFRELLFRAVEKREFEFNQSELSKCLNVSLTNVNHALKPLRKMNAVQVKPRICKIVSQKKILLYWASVREPEKDLLLKARIDLPVKEIEKRMPLGIFFTGYSGYKFKFNDVPADYSEVHIYAGESEIAELKKRFDFMEKNPNFFIFKKDDLMQKYGKQVSNAQLFVDLWNLPEWYAKDFLKAFEGKLYGLLE